MENLVKLNQTLEVISLDYGRGLTAEDFIQEFLKERNTENTKKVYERSIREFFTFLYGDQVVTIEMMKIDPLHARKYFMYWQEKLDNEEIKISTYNQKIKGVKSFYDWLIKNLRSNIHEYAFMEFNPFDTIKQKAETDAEGCDALTPDEVILMLNNPYGHSEHIKERNLLIFVLAISTGIRNTALVSITENNIKKIGNEFLVDTIDKEGKKALMPINNYYNRLMAWYHNDLKIRTDGDTIFNITPIHASRMIKAWAKSKDVGIEKNITFHSLRATTAVRVYEDNDGNLAKVKSVLHHSRIETSAIYADKGYKINHDAENVVEEILYSDKFDELMTNKNKDELLQILLKLDRGTKMRLLREMDL